MKAPDTENQLNDEMREASLPHSGEFDPLNWIQSSHISDQNDQFRYIMNINLQNDVTIFLILSLLYFAVSLPFAWGYIVVNVATG